MTLRRTFGSLAAIVALTAAVFLYVAHPVRGSDHQDAPIMLNHPATDITDVYLFPDPSNAGNVVFAMDVYPLLTHATAGAASFNPDALYQFKIVNGALGSTNPENTVIQVTAGGVGKNQRLTLRGPGAPVTPGLDSQLLPAMGSFPLNKVTTFSNGIVAIAGQRADPFFFDLFQFFKILPDRLYSNPRTGDKLGTSTPTFNGYSKGSTSGPSGSGYACSTNPSTNALTQIGSPPGFNVLGLVVSIPKSMLVSGSAVVADPRMGDDEPADRYLSGQTHLPSARTARAAGGQGTVRDVRVSSADELGEPLQRPIHRGLDRVLHGERRRPEPGDHATSCSPCSRRTNSPPTCRNRRRTAPRISASRPAARPAANGAVAASPTTSSTSRSVPFSVTRSPRSGSHRTTARRTTA